jgi:drug/metabolite transporter (DMT)-like permease
LVGSKNRARLWADLSLLGVAAIWGATFVMVKEALDSTGPLSFLALRFTLAGLVLLPVLIGRRTRLSLALLAGGSLVGLALFAGYALQTAGLQFTSASKAGFITGLAVVIVPALTTILVRKPPSWPLSLGVVLATAGLALTSVESDLTVQVGDLLVLGCAISFALHILAVGHFAPSHDVLALTAVQIISAALLTSLGALLFEAPSLDQFATVLPAALFTGVFATVAAFYLQTRAQRFTTPTHTALIFSMEPVFAALFGYLLAGELLELRAVVGCGCILAGMLIAQLSAET